MYLGGERVRALTQASSGSQTLLQSLTENMASLASPAAARTPGPGTQDVQIVAPGTLTATTPYFRYFYGRVSSPASERHPAQAAGAGNAHENDRSIHLPVGI